MRKKLRLSLEGLCLAAQYAGALYVSLCCPLLPERTRLLPGVEGSRAWLMLWTAVLLLLSALLDRALERASKKDALERAQGVPGGGLNRSTLLALSTPALFLADLIAAAHIHLSYFYSGAQPSASPALVGAMAAGAVLWIYGRRLPRVAFGSALGVRTKKTAASPEAWAAAQKKAAPFFLAGGAAALFAGTFLPPFAALAVACAGVAAALTGVVLAGR